jgi:hypothetical protein
VFEIKAGGACESFAFHVADTDQFSALVGSDVLERLRAVVDYGTQQIRFGHALSMTNQTTPAPSDKTEECSAAAAHVVTHTEQLKQEDQEGHDQCEAVTTTTPSMCALRIERTIAAAECETRLCDESKAIADGGPVGEAAVNERFECCQARSEGATNLRALLNDTEVSTADDTPAQITNGAEPQEWTYDAIEDAQVQRKRGYDARVRQIGYKVGELGYLNPPNDVFEGPTFIRKRKVNLCPARKLTALVMKWSTSIA